MRIARTAATAVALLAVMACSAVGAATLVAPQAAAFVAPTAVFIGDSYTQAGGLPEAQRWPTIVAREMVWQAVNLGRGGTGYLGSVSGGNARNACGMDYCPSFAEMIDDAAGHNPAVIVVAGGRNERGAWTDPAWAQGVIDFYRDLRAAAPQAVIYAVAPMWDDDPAPAESIFAYLVVQHAALKAGAVFVDLREPLAGQPELIARDGVHPNGDGHAAIAEAFAAAAG
jgi:lysophospholipase L1-like esterase